jgi:hypothetical protein
VLPIFRHQGGKWNRRPQLEGEFNDENLRLTAWGSRPNHSELEVAAGTVSSQLPVSINIGVFVAFSMGHNDLYLIARQSFVLERFFGHCLNGFPVLTEEFSGLADPVGFVSSAFDFGHVTSQQADNIRSR